MKFKEWLLNEISEIVKGPIRLYHGADTGINNENLKRFLQQGALPTGTGWGQGGGFFVWTSLANAKNHAKKRLQRELPSPVRAEGNPMVVILELPEIDFKNWDLDIEGHAQDIVDYGYRKAPQLAKLGQVELSPKSKEYLAKSKKGEWEPKPIAFDKVKRNDLGNLGIYANSHLKSFAPSTSKYYDPQNDNPESMQDAEYFAPFYYAHQDASKGKHEKIEAWFFKKNYGKKTMLLKYTGQQPLPVSQILVFNGTDWVPSN